MTRLHWFFITLFLQFKVNIEAAATGSVVCHSNHTATITISNVADLAAFTENDWRIDDKAECQPNFTDATTVTYFDLPVSTCAVSPPTERDNDILYTFQIRVLAAKAGPVLGVDHMFDASCAYGNTDAVMASFEPLTKRRANGSDFGSFTFNFDGFSNAGLTTSLSSPLGLNKTLYFRLQVVTSSLSHNLDLFIISCHASSSDSPASPDNKVDLIENGCGNDNTSDDAGDTLSYTCVNDTKTETFSISSFRYFGADPGDLVYLHCEVRVCLADKSDSACECPTVAQCDPNARKRRAVSDDVVIRVTKGPYHFVDEEKVVEKDVVVDDEPQVEDRGTFQLSLAIILAISGIVVLVIACLTVFLFMRKRRQRFSLTEKNTPPVNNGNVKT